MRILFLAPQPFFQERGTPIAVRLALQVLAARNQDDIDLLVYREGSEISIPRVRVHRIKSPSLIGKIGPGISCRKLLADVIFFFTALRMVWSARKEPYALVHAVEEAVFMALVIRWLTGIPYIYDMDSSLALQLTEKWYLLRPLRPILEWFEKQAIRSSVAVVPVCDALAAIARRYGRADATVLSDISLLDLGLPHDGPVDLRKEAGLSADAIILLYTGNLEGYQGIDLLLNSFARVAPLTSLATLIVIGGSEDHCRHYRDQAAALGLSQRVQFLGPRPVAALRDYLTQSDILVSPRVMGNNTPMKIFSYLHSGRPIVATALPTHTQVMDSSVAILAEATPEEFGAALLRIIKNPEERRVIGERAMRLAQQKYTFENFSQTLCGIYDRVGRSVSTGPSPACAAVQHRSIGPNQDNAAASEKI